MGPQPEVQSAGSLQLLAPLGLALGLASAVSTSSLGHANSRAVPRWLDEAGGIKPLPCHHCPRWPGAFLSLHCNSASSPAQICFFSLPFTGVNP